MIIKTKPQSKEYDDNYDRIFRKCQPTLNTNPVQAVDKKKTPIDFPPKKEYNSKTT